MKNLLIILITIVIITSFPNYGFSAEGYELKEMTPQVEAALEARRARYDELGAFKAAGVVGENNRGYAELLSDDADAQNIVDTENQDRKIIYMTIAQQNELEDDLETIEKVFAQVKKEKAKSGEKIQNEDGTWVEVE